MTKTPGKEQLRPRIRRLHGTIAFLNHAQGYGYVDLDDDKQTDGLRVWFHASAVVLEGRIEKFEQLVVGDRVVLTVMPARQAGKNPEGGKVRVLDDGDEEDDAEDQNDG